MIFLFFATTLTNINRLPKEKIEKLWKNYFHTSVRRGNEKNRVFLNSMQFHFREFILGKEKRMINFISRSRRLRIGVASSIYGKIRSNECRRSESNEIISYIGNFNERKERSRLVKLAESRSVSITNPWKVFSTFAERMKRSTRLKELVPLSPGRGESGHATAAKT